MKRYQLSFVLFLFISAVLSFGTSCKPQQVEPDPTAWVDQLDTSVNAAAKTKIRAWITEGLSASKMAAAFKLYTTGGEFFKILDASKSIFHKRVLTDDAVETIPGITLSAFAANGLPRTLIAATPANTDLDLPASEAPNFVNAATIDLAVGQKIYRVIGGSGSFPTGSYWVENKPTNYADIIGGTAVQPEWNGFNEIVEYTVPAGGLKVWKGKAAAQAIASTPNKFVTAYVAKYKLAGGIDQLYVPNIYRDYRDTAVYNKFLRNITKRDTILWKKN
jgi:hypothetical protein